MADGGASGRLLIEVAWRFLRGRRSPLLDGAARSAFGAVAIGVTAMVVAMALMAGYRDALERKLLQDSAAVMVYPLSLDSLQPSSEVADIVRSVPGVVGLRRVVYGQGSLRSRARPEGVDVTLRGVDQPGAVGGLGRVTRLPRPASSEELTELVVGSEVAAALEVGEDEVVRLLVLGVLQGRPHFSYRSAVISAVFSSGLAEFDQKLVVLERETLEMLIGASVGDTIVEVLVENPGRAAEVAALVDQRLGADFLVASWQDLNRELFTALEVQKMALFLVLGLIVVVSTFNVASSLLVLVRERSRDIGVLAALGLSSRALRRLFLLYGGGLSLAGVVAGIAFGTGLAWFLTRYDLIRFDAELAAIYFLHSVPLEVRWADVAAVAAFTLIVTVAACWLPARRLGRLDPATALRTE
jgi:lipoprotein-releasing system permease protein